MDWSERSLIWLVLALTVLFVMKSASFWKRGSRKDIPPGPRPLPLIGNLLIMDLKRPFQTILELSETYGPVFSIQMGLTKMVVIAGYETVKEALVNQADAFAERPYVPFFEEVAKGNGIILSHGETWKVMRRFTLSTLRDFGMGKRAIEDKIVEECESLIEKLESQKGKPFESTTIMAGAVANIIVSILLGERFGYEDTRFIKLLNLINENNVTAGSASIAVYNMFPVLGFFLRSYKIALQNKEEFHTFIEKTFVEHLKTLDKNDQRSFIDAFLVKQQEEKSKTNGYFHNENLKTLVSDLFFAGTETTSNTLCWAFLLMIKYPHIQQKVQDEIKTVLGSNLPRVEHRTKMPYTDAVVHEIQRFANILPTSVSRMTTMDVTLKGHFIPKGTHIIPLLSSVLRDKSQWKRPNDFCPENFLDSEGKFAKKEAFMPFAAGRRVCAGENLAKMELFLFFTSLLQRFTFHPAPGVSSADLDLTPGAGFTTPPKPHQLCVVPLALGF